MKEIEVLNDVIERAEEFSMKARELKEFLQDRESFTYASKIRSSARRSSMDLSRSLTEFRRAK